MNASVSGGYLRDMHTLFDAGTVSGLTDRQLLQRFTGEQGPSAEAAFEAIVLRHGPMVMRVCRNALGQEQAEIHDAFQATFLVLVKKVQVDPAAGLGGELALRRGDARGSPPRLEAAGAARPKSGVGCESRRLPIAGVIIPPTFMTSGRCYRPRLSGCRTAFGLWCFCATGRA